jgi:hypothetical protein
MDLHADNSVRVDEESFTFRAATPPQYLEQETCTVVVSATIREDTV